MQANSYLNANVNIFYSFFENHELFDDSSKYATSNQVQNKMTTMQKWIKNELDV